MIDFCDVTDRQDWNAKRSTEYTAYVSDQRSECQFRIFDYIIVSA